MLRLMRQFLGAGWQPRRVCFEHPAPRDPSAHLRLFGRRVEFDQDYNCIVCAKADLDTRNPSADPAMVRYAQQLLDASAKKQEATMLVRRTILLLLPSGRCTIEQVAQHLGMVCRTLQRRLTEQGENFSSMVNEIRKELATRHVLEGGRPLTEVSMLLGFSAPSAFSRWYHAQFGCSAQGTANPNQQEPDMTTTLTLVICMAILTWLALLAASLIRVKGWTFPGTMLAFGNRDNLPQATPLAGRAERAARNTLENFVFFAAIALVAHASGATSPKLALGAEVFFWARLIYIPVYYAGIVYLRTAIWVVSIVGLAMVIAAIF